jgi:hypothetical protein
MNKREFYQQAMLMALNALLSNPETNVSDSNHATISAQAHLYAEALTTKMYIETNKDTNNLK